MIGIDLLMNPKKRISSSGSENVYRIGDDDYVSEASIPVRRVSKMSVKPSKEKASKTSKSSKRSSKSSRSSSSTVSSSSSESSSSSSGSGSGSSSSNSSSSSSGSESSYSSVSSYAVSAKKKLSQEDIINMKKDLLYQFDRLEKRGIKIPKKFSLASSLEEMKVEYDRLKKDREVDVSVRFQRKMLMAIITGIEFLNDKFDPFDVNLDGWSENVNDGINDYDDIFEELHEKYKGKANLAPELKLMFALAGSGFMFHLRTSMFKSALPGMANMQQGGQQQQQYQQQQQQPKQSSGFGGLGGLVSGLMGGGGGGGMGGIGSIIGSMLGGMGQQQQPQQQQQRPSNMNMNMQSMPNPTAQMRGPTNVDDILKELANERIDAISTISESEMSEMVDDMSDKGVFVTQKTTGRRTLNL